MLQSYKCFIIKVKKKYFFASVMDLDEQIEFAFTNVALDELKLVKKGACFVWFITRYNQRVISFNFPSSSSDRP